MQQPAPRRLMRSADRRLGGVCGGIAEYFALDPSLVRVIAVVLLLFGPLGGATFAGYVILWIVLPEAAGAPSPAASGPASPRERADTGFIIGLGLLAVGAWLLLGRLGWGWMGMGWMHGGWFPGVAAGPLILIVAGLLVVILARRQRP